MPTTEQLTAQLDELAAFDSGPYPVISLYLNLQPGEQGRDQFDAFVRNALPERKTIAGLPTIFCNCTSRLFIPGGTVN